MKLEVFKGCVLHSGYPWVEHKFGDRDAILDGRFTSDELREIADAMDDNAVRAPWPEHRGGKARAQKMTAERRSEIAKAAAARRWKKQDCT